jgi:Sulfotransferase family
LAKPTTWIVRFINAGGLGSGFASVMLWIINTLLVQPALKRSIELMEQADNEGTAPWILCNEQARDDMQERVQVYYNAIRSSPTLTQMGKIINFAGAYQCLVNHQGIFQLGMNAQVQNEQVKEPLVIVSLPRTGTTILHRTMAKDMTRFRNFDLCDMVCPLPKPIPRWDTQARAAKAHEANKLINGIAALYPGWKECLETMHGFRPAEAEEDMGWYGTGLGHMYMDPLMKLYPEYRRMEPNKLISKEVANYSYAWLKMVMQIYQYTDVEEWEKKQGEQLSPCPTKDLPWILKDPNHSAFLPQLLEAFPDAKLIFTHRNPGDIVASMAKLFVVFTIVEHNPGAAGTTTNEWGQETLLKMKDYCNGMVEFTKWQTKDSSYTIDGQNRFDFYFKNVVQDIPGTIDAIYEKFYPDQPGPSVEAKAAFREYLEQNEREIHGNQRRSLEDFHLTKKP